MFGNVTAGVRYRTFYQRREFYVHLLKSKNPLKSLSPKARQYESAYRPPDERQSLC